MLQLPCTFCWLWIWLVWHDRDWSVCMCVCVLRLEKWQKMTIRKGIVVPFLPCLVAFWGFHPYIFFHFVKCFFVTCFCLFFLWGGERYEWCLDGVVVWGR